MTQSNKRDIPAYVYKFINIHVAHLIQTQCFSFQEKEDLKQELLLFYIEKFFCLEQSPPEELIFIALKRESGHILRSRFRFLNSGGNATDSVFELESKGIEICAQTSLADIEDQIALNEVISKLSKKDAEVINMVLQGYNLGEIIKELHVSYAVISRICEKIKKLKIVW